MARQVPFVTVHAPRGMVTTVDHLASGAGVAMLRAGGSAVDAAIAANAVLAVTTQHMCGLGGDLFAVVHDGTGVVALDASGRSGSGSDAARLRDAGHTAVPFRGDVAAVTVPGCVDGWVALHERHGRLPLGDVLAPAIEYARDGFPASPLLAGAVRGLAGVEHTDDYPPGLRAGEVVRRPGVARALADLAAGGRDAWYRGEFGTRLVGLGRGQFTPDDLAARHAEWVTPLHLEVWGHEVWTVPPGSQGYVTLAAAWIAQGLPLPDDPDDPRWAHLLVEAAKQAGHDRPAVLHEGADGDALLAPERLAPRRDAIDAASATRVGAPAAAGGTVHLNAVDAGGLAVSLTQSNCAGFGAHVVVPGVRVFLHNRGTGFSLVPGHPAELGPRRRPPHTLCPTLVTAPGGAPRWVLGTMGADSQPMVLLQLLARLLQAGQDPATAVAAARFVLTGPDAAPFGVWTEPSALRVRVEAGASEAWIRGLRERGHEVEEIEPFAYVAGHAHVVGVADGTLAGAADPRARTGAASGW